MRACLVWPLVVIVAVAAATPLAQQPVPGFADPILGRWDLTVRGADGAYPSWLELMLRKRPS